MSGAICGGAGEKDLEYLSEYGAKLGLAFQIKMTSLTLPVILP
jgi:geranylgeranyl pyrophosphate synthase